MMSRLALDCLACALLLADFLSCLLLGQVPTQTVEERRVQKWCHTQGQKVSTDGGLNGGEFCVRFEDDLASMTDDA